MVNRREPRAASSHETPNAWPRRQHPMCVVPWARGAPAQLRHRLGFQGRRFPAKGGVLGMSSAWGSARGCLVALASELSPALPAESAPHSLKMRTNRYCAGPWVGCWESTSLPSLRICLCQILCLELYICHLFKSLHSCKAGIIIPILNIEHPLLREVKELVQRHTGSKCWS